MTSIYFVRHAQPIHSWEDDRTRPLSAEGETDAKKVAEVLKHLPIEGFYSSPYRRCIDTVSESAAWFGMEIQTDERFRERKSGRGSNNSEMFLKRWSDFSVCEENGESLWRVQKRNIEALSELLRRCSGKHIVIATHGTALSTILNHYDSNFLYDDFMRIIDFMPYMIRLDFEGTELRAKEEVLIIKKIYNGT